MSHWLNEVAQQAIDYINAIDERAVFPSEQALADLAQFDEPFPEASTAPENVIKQLQRIGAPATVATTGSRYFGFVTGGVVPAAMGANFLINAWDQNGGLRIMSPINGMLEEIAINWLIDALDLPAECVGGLVTGATMANFTALAAARHHLLARKEWDVEAQGLFGAPEIKVVVGEEVHVSILQALSMVGFGRERVIRVPVDEHGAMLADSLPDLDDMTLICIQAGNVNSGAFDPATTICEQAQSAGAWVHVDGAFGLWVRATETRKHLAEGYHLADSWATDGHKWLNVSYDNGIVLCKHPKALQRAMTIRAPYLVMGDAREPEHYTPEQSRRARGIEVWAALKSLGRQGIREMIERDCDLAIYFAEGLHELGYEVLNDVVINQVLVAFGEDDITRLVIEAIQQEGTLWAGPSVWKGRTGMRISVSSWKTTREDIDRCLVAIEEIARAVHESMV